MSKKTIEIKVKLVRDIARLPEKKTIGASGFDLFSAVDTIIEPKTFQGVPTGLALEMPKSIEAQVRPRSGLALNHGIGVLNSPGTIDSDYRGEVVVILFNFSNTPFVIKKGDRIAQLVFASVVKVNLKKTKKLSRTKRGKGGFGHTGR
jgi:dUTP pyrophosphatase|uniref:Deoxyuridine 5'-triphosphate nucleotidohydrolase n=1 Tax=candidate division WOR-3 bacterium TaxID=2052148 RepID=A0A7C6A9Z4_UNCW3